MTAKGVAVAAPLTSPSFVPTEQLNEDISEQDELTIQFRKEALEALNDEPELEYLLNQTVLAPHVKTFDDAVATTIAFRLLNGTTGTCCSLETIRNIIASALRETSVEYYELGHTMGEAVRKDALAVLHRDPACQTILEVVLFFKGFASLVCHRAARYLHLKKKKPKRSMLSLFLQSQASAMFGVDIHPAAQIGAGVLLDHGTGVVIGETAVLGEGCTLLHGVTLGGTGKDTGDRHPKIGKHVLVGAGACILGNIHVGDNAKIGAGSIVLRSIPSGATAVGAPARIIGRAKEPDPASTVDELLEGVSLVHKQHRGQNNVQRVDSMLTATTVSSETESDSDDSPDCMCPFRDLRRLGMEAPPNTVTFCALYKMLSPFNVESSELGEVYFAMDKDMVGYIEMTYFTDHAVEVIERFTSIPRKQCEELLYDYLEKQQKQSKGNGSK